MPAISFKTAPQSPATDGHVRAPLYVLSNFQILLPRFRSSQNTARQWLIDAHRRAGYSGQVSIEALLDRFSATADDIAYRGHELSDFTSRRPERMKLFGPAGSDITAKTRFFEERVTAIFKRLYAVTEEAPAGIVHVTCTGYTAPSGAQHLVSARGWGRQTQVLHAYHMGCYAAHPAIRMAGGLRDTASEPGSSIDIVHTELCSLHFDPTQHDPGQLVIQSLFADGFIKYQLKTADSCSREAESSYLEILAAHDEIIPDSLHAMGWETGPVSFIMMLSKEVPILLAGALPRFVRSLFEAAGLDAEAEKPAAVFAIHPGGPRIVELAQRILRLDAHQVASSRHILREHGNMSSATLPHIWQHILQDVTVPDGTLIMSVGAGPGLTLSGIIFRKRTI